LPDPYRVALYYAPESADPLWTRGNSWLGRDPAQNIALPQPDIDGIFAATTDPRRYGFHCTVKPPMRLRGSFPAFLADAETFAATQKPFTLPALRVASFGRYIALGLAAPSPEMHALADGCVAELDPHRLPEDPAAKTKRAAGRTASELRNLERWGYPLVMKDWRFHMTLSNALEPNFLAASAATYFADVLGTPRQVSSLAVYVEMEKSTPFQLVKRLAFSK